jgi:hypothetical protein
MGLGVAVIVLVLVGACSSPALTASPVAACEPTLPNGDAPPGHEPGPNWYGNGSLYTALWPNGEIIASRAFVRADGSIGMKFPWWRAPGVGAAGDLRITGREVTTGANISAEIPDGYGPRFQASGIIFPTEGCYEITAKSGDAELTFTTKVTKEAAAALNS